MSRKLRNSLARSSISKMSKGTSRKASKTLKKSRMGSYMSSRKGSDGGETNYYSIGSDYEEFDDEMDEDGDIFYEPFEQEAELLCYNEVQKTAKMFEGANQIFINDLDIIEEMEADTHTFYKKKNELKQSEDVGEDLDLSLYLYISEVIFFLYSRRDKHTACSVHI
jgi:hypothetical protein